jgi:transcriptional regulator with XRE-family HTH domain
MVGERGKVSTMTKPRGRWAWFLQRMRQERGWSQQRAFEELRVGLHLGPKSRASYRAIDIGERLPTPAEQEFFVKYFRKSPDDFPEAVEPTEPADALVEALRSQTEAISALVSGLDVLTVGQATAAGEMM